MAASGGQVVRRLPLALALLGAAAWSGLLWAGPGRAAFLEPLTVNEPVSGDVVAVGGDVILGPEARIDGHAVSVFGRVITEPGARVAGRTLEVASLSSLSLREEGKATPVGVRAGVRLIDCGGWLLVTTLIAVLFPAWLRRSVVTVGGLGVRVAVMGALVAATLIAALVAVLGLGGPVGIGLAIALMLAFFLAKALGLAIIGAALGRWLLHRLVHRLAPVSAAVFLGVTMLLGLRFLPLLGDPAWTMVSVVAVGAGVLGVLLVRLDGAVAPVPAHN